MVGWLVKWGHISSENHFKGGIPSRTRSRNFTYWGLGIIKQIKSQATQWPLYIGFRITFIKLYASLRELNDSKNFTHMYTAAIFLIGAQELYYASSIFLNLGQVRQVRLDIHLLFIYTPTAAHFLIGAQEYLVRLVYFRLVQLDISSSITHNLSPSFTHNVPTVPPLLAYRPAYLGPQIAPIAVALLGLDHPNSQLAGDIRPHTSCMKRVANCSGFYTVLQDFNRKGGAEIVHFGPDLYDFGVFITWPFALGFRLIYTIQEFSCFIV